MNIQNLIYDFSIGMGMPVGKIRREQLKSIFDRAQNDESFKGKVLRTQGGPGYLNHTLTYYDPVLKTTVVIEAELDKEDQPVTVTIPEIRTVLAGFTGLLFFAQSNLTRKGGNPTRGHQAMEEFFDRATHLSHLTGAVFGTEAPGRMEKPQPVSCWFGYSSAEKECYMLVGTTSDREAHAFEYLAFSFSTLWNGKSDGLNPSPRKGIFSYTGKPP